ncbi:MAG: NAD(P)H-hydrate dehydratase [Ignavibacteria bacterium]|nr:NAD(P)H-hydrate dehydratase [Ignavibacteria bacterium]
MKYILTPEEMKNADKNAIENYGVPSIVLMENAARSSAIFIHQIIAELGLKEPSFTFFCGSGNNGGDGFALARHLFDLYKVRVFWIGDETKMSEETHTNFLAAKRLGIPVTKLENNEEVERLTLDTEIIVDALIGVGGNENIRGLALDILRKIKNSKSVKIAIDCPTGLNSLNGVANEFCFEADYTITMFTYKLGLLINRGPDFTGKILVANLGVPNFIVKSISKTFAYETEDLPLLIPTRYRRSSKFNYGRVLIIAGSERYPGAAALTANASIKSGAGLTILASTNFHPALLPEVIRFPLPATVSGSIAKNSYDILLDEIEKSDAIAIGPGLTDDSETLSLVKKIIDNFKDRKKIVLDADGLKILDPNSILTKNVIITPHSGELSKITGIQRSQIEQNSYFLAKEWASKLNCIIHLKSVPPVTTDGEISYLCLTGNPGMASGGSGDVLTGIISTFAARGLPQLIAASLGAFVHSLAGDNYAQKYGMETLTASSLIDCLPEVL